MVILLVEDDFVVAHGVTCALEGAGHCVLGPVRSVGAALELVDDLRPDLALVDINLGAGEDGTAVAGALYRRCDVPSIFISGERRLAYAARDVALGFVGKPFLPGTMVDCVEFIRGLKAGRMPDPPPKLELF